MRCERCGSSESLIKNGSQFLRNGVKRATRYICRPCNRLKKPKIAENPRERNERIMRRVFL